MRRFCPAAKRRREIVKHALYVGAADTEDFDRWLISWAQHNPRSKDPIGALMMAAERMGRPISEAYAETILDEAKRGRRYHKANSVGRLLGVTYAVRQRLRLTTIGCIDVSKRGRKHLRKVRDKIKKRNSRRAAGVRSRAEYEANSIVAQARAEGVSRMTLYRRKRAEQAKNSPDVTGVSTAFFLSPADRPVTWRESGPPERDTSCPSTMVVDRYETLPLELRWMALGLPMPESLAKAA